jgi:hypothetical protein
VPVLTEPEWRDREAAHEARVDALVADHLARRRGGVPHPVHDFLFTYYSFRPAQLRRWHPGYGVLLAGRESEAVTEADVEARRALVEGIHALLTATAGRAANFGCFGMHEWTMVYRQSQDETRHAAWPLRLGPAGTAEVVDSHRIACSHFDAFRFFTDAARPLNTLSPAAHDRPAFEQPACLHAGMDLYKAAYRLSPLIPSDLILDAFELAWDIRVLDMRAAPYDFRGLVIDHTGEEWTPVRIETPEGKQEYAAAQRVFAARGQDLRSRLLQVCERLLA